MTVKTVFQQDPGFPAEQNHPDCTRWYVHDDQSISNAPWQGDICCCDCTSKPTLEDVKAVAPGLFQ